MNDLISRDEVLKIIEETRKDKLKSNFVSLEKKINRIPTVFDLDKVISELQELKTYKLDLTDTMTEIMARGKSATYICLEDAIELLKNYLSGTAEPPKTD